MRCIFPLENLRKSCLRIITQNKNLCWTEPAGWGLKTQQEVCDRCEINNVSIIIELKIPEPPKSRSIRPRTHRKHVTSRRGFRNVNPERTYCACCKIAKIKSKDVIAGISRCPKCR